uniref:Uncharacterized protein n=1 Tax=Panagrolaimus sp. JU765 TaxID=591449 RepID=A0AC34PXJ9_9BILA
KYKLLILKKEFKGALQILRGLLVKEPDFLIFQEDFEKVEKMMKEQLEQEKLVYKRMLGALGKPNVRAKLPIVQPQRNFKRFLLPVFVVILAVGFYYFGKYWNFKLI